MSYFIIDNFISEKDCELLLKDSSFVNEGDYIKTHNNKRLLLASSNIHYRNLINKSDNWKNLSNKLDSKNFLDLIKKKFDIKKNFYFYRYYSNFPKINKYFLKYKNLGLLQLNRIGTSALIKYMLYRIYRSIDKFIKCGLINLIKGQPLELLYDYSKAINGYKNDVHSDTYHRVFIFLLYLNKLEDGSKGGNLKIYKNISNTSSVSPNEEEYELCESISPKPGRLVLMINDNQFFHSVDKISNLNGTRDFIYGGYTILAGKNPFQLNQSMPTGLHLYD